MTTVEPNTSEISITIGMKYSHEIIDFMLQNQIPFNMSTVYETTPPISKQVAPNQYLIANQKKNTPLPTNIFEMVFQKYISNNLETPHPNLEEIAKELGMSVQTFKNKFQKIHGKSFHQAYLEKKMEHAANLLKQGLTSSAISTRIGYAHPIQFNKVFQKHYGITPKKYQMMNR